MAHKGHYFKCCNCGYIGEESELPEDKNHDCGKDQCPECKDESCILCCFESSEDAEMEHWNTNDCECPKCKPELYIID